MTVDASMIFEFLLVPLIIWNMYTTNKSDKRLEILEYEIKELEGTDKRITVIETEQKTFYETIGGIKSDLHDIRNFLVRVVTKDDPEGIKEYIDAMSRGKI